MDPHASIPAVALNEAAPAGGLDSSPLLALCRVEPGQDLACTLAAELALNAEGQAPEWVELLPAGDPLVAARDGRTWRNPDPAAVVATTLEHKLLPMPIDLDHASELPLAERMGRPAPAAGWIEEIAVREGAIWARVAWTTRGAELVRNREYRYLSPAFAHTRTDRRVLFISSAALVNKPAFPQLALSTEHREEPMDKEQRKALCAALGLAETATDAEVVAAAQKLKTELATAAEQAQPPPLDKFVPRADYDVAVSKATAAEAKLAERDKADLDKAIETEISAALEATKITPATASYYRAMCAQEGGLEKFKEFARAAPVLAPDQVITGDPANPVGGKLTADERAICQQMGLSEEQFLAAKA